MKKRDKIIALVAVVVFFLSLFVGAALLDDAVISRSTFTAIIVIETVLLVAYLVYLFCKHFSAAKRAKKSREERREATMSATLKHVSGLPIAKDLPVEMFYGPDKITFKKGGQEITVSREKVTGIDLVMGEGSARKAMSGAATGKYVVGGAAGATVGALAAIAPRLVISYTSEGKSKSITLDTAASGTFASRVVKDFQQTHNQKRSTVEL